MSRDTGTTMREGLLQLAGRDDSQRAEFIRAVITRLDDLEAMVSASHSQLIESGVDKASLRKQVDQLEADKAELVDALEWRADECETQIVVIGHDGRRSNCGCGVCKSDRALIAKHKAKP